MAIEGALLLKLQFGVPFFWLQPSMLSRLASSFVAFLAFPVVLCGFVSLLPASRRGFQHLTRLELLWEILYPDYFVRLGGEFPFRTCGVIYEGR